MAREAGFKCVMRGREMTMMTNRRGPQRRTQKLHQFVLEGLKVWPPLIDKALPEVRAWSSGAVNHSSSAQTERLLPKCICKSNQE